MATETGISVPAEKRPDGWQARVVSVDADLFTRDVAKVAGYSITTGPPLAQAQAQTPAAGADPRTEQACADQASRASSPPPELEAQFQSLLHEAEVRTEADARVATAQVAWATCIHDGLGLDVTQTSQLPASIALIANEELSRRGEGVAVANASDPRLRSLPPSPALLSEIRGFAGDNLPAGERRIALADAGCREHTGLNNAIVEARRSVQQTLVDANLALLTRYRLALRDLLAAQGSGRS
jgi:hypothetical protein